MTVIGGAGGGRRLVHVATMALLGLVLTAAAELSTQSQSVKYAVDDFLTAIRAA